MKTPAIIRRGALVFLLVITLGSCLASPDPGAQATVSGRIRTDLTGLTVSQHKIVGCSCCDRWASYLGNLGADVYTVPDAEIDQFRSAAGVPPDGASCHTAIIDEYVVEGHVPAEAILKLLNEGPDAIGITTPGMPPGSPGMGGSQETWDETVVYLINRDSTLTLFEY